MFHPKNQTQNIAELMRQMHGIDINASDLNTLIDLNREARSRRYRLSDAPIEAEIEAKGIGKIVLSTAVGFLTGGLGGAIVGLVMGVGSSLLTERQQPEQETSDETYAPQYGFNSGGRLATVGGPIPLIYGSRAVNPNGGVRVAGHLINSRIDTELGTNTLFQLYSISLGTLGAIDVDQTLFDEQPRNKFVRREIDTYIRVGDDPQNPIEEFPFYSQVISPSNYNVFGYDERSNVNNPQQVVPVGTANVTNVEVPNPGIIRALPAAGGFGTAGLFGTDPINPVTGGGFIEFRASESDSNRALGLSNNDIDLDWISIEHGFRLRDDGEFRIIESGVQTNDGAFLAGNSNYSNGTTFRVRIQPNGRIRYFKNGTLIFESVTIAAGDYFLDTAFTNDSQVTQVRVNPGGLIQPDTVTQTVIEIDPDNDGDAEFGEFNPSDTYATCQPDNNPNNPEPDYLQPFIVVEKDPDTETLTIEPEIEGEDLTVGDGDRIYAIWTCKYETTKRVSEIHLNMNFSLYARDPEDGDNKDHGQVFDLYMRQIDVPDTLVDPEFIIRFFVETKTPTVVRRGLKIKNLALGRYYLEIRPAVCNVLDNVDNPIIDVWRLGDYGVFREIEVAHGFPRTEGPIYIVGEFDENPNESGLVDELSYDPDEKTQISTEQGPPGKLVSVNEVVTVEALSNSLNNVTIADDENGYPGIALVGYKFLASNRLQSPPNISVLVSQGRVIPNYIAAGQASALSTNMELNDPNADFNDPDALVLTGMVVRNLTQKREDTITGKTANRIQTAGNLRWNEFDRYVVYSLSATPYFPDIYVDLLTNPVGGIGEIVDGDRFIDYPSVTRSRKFCVQNDYFWDGFLRDSTAFAQWADNEARGNLLFPLKVGGRFGLIPDEATDPIAVFNASNVRDFEEEFAPWYEQETNTMVVTYTDGSEKEDDDGVRFRPKNVIVQTADAYNGTVQRVERSASFNHVTNLGQAVDVGIVMLKALREQTRKIQFTTFGQGCYVASGDIIIVQHLITEYGEEYSGFVRNFDAPTNPGTGLSQAVQISKCNYLVFDGCVTTGGANSIIDTSQNFNESGVEAGDLVYFPETQVSTTVAAVISDTQLQLAAGNTVVNQTYCIFNGSFAGTSVAVLFREDNSVATGLIISGTELRDGEQWVTVEGLPQQLQRLDPIVIGRDIEVESTYRVNSTTPNSKGEIVITAASWNPTLVPEKQEDPNDNNALKTVVPDGYIVSDIDGVFLEGDLISQVS